MMGTTESGRIAVNALSLTAAVALVSCARPSIPADPEAFLTKARAECGLVRDEMTWEMFEEQTIGIRPAPDTAYQKVDCFISKVDDAGFELGFVGNEAVQ